jgi:hypothetical protein
MGSVPTFAEASVDKLAFYTFPFSSQPMADSF